MVSSYALRPGFTPLTVILMVIGFMIAWPLGLVMLAYMLWGDRIPNVRRHFDGMKSNWSRDWHGCGPRAARYGFTRSGNAAFDDYREKELKRLDEERRRLEEERRQFESYVSDLRRARDQEEFDRFMKSRSNQKSGDQIDL